MSRLPVLNWTSPGPVSSAFMNSTAPVQILNGPIGGGKTSTNFMKHIRNALKQRASTRDGVRKYKLCTVRADYRQLWRATIPSWWTWMPKQLGEWVGPHDAPARHVIEFDTPVGRVRFEHEFIALGDNRVEDVLRGYEPTAFFLDELDLLPREALDFSRGRAGRYPPEAEGGASWYGVTGACNAPELDSWLYDLFFDHAPEIAIFRQPGGREAKAENLPNLPAGYYENQAAGNDPMYVARMVDNKPGYSRHGRAVYGAEFADARHVSPVALEPVPALPLVLGADAGLSPACAVLQRMGDGQWRVLGELCAEHGTGPSRFGRDLARFLRARFPGCQVGEAWADPASAFGGDRQSRETLEDRAWIEIVSEAAGVRFRPAPGGNALQGRLDAVKHALTAPMEGGRPGLLLDPRCSVLRKGFNAAYRYRRMQTADGRYADAPDKNDVSHVHDALQYALVGGGELRAVLGRKASRQAGPAMAVTDFEVL